ncbi:hypothetical protein DBV15_12727 [Temnothorax longispinosus]|uniref:Uncharacterized protein n=1 Tax=Temnothorax longispinosus TaxID=300112 RepID=A0A4S2JKT5_9HYME|nr:hypothetical protein DBV15_12727 [Temnothorax longispinosus]
MCSDADGYFKSRTIKLIKHISKALNMFSAYTRRYQFLQKLLEFLLKKVLRE